MKQDKLKQEYLKAIDEIKKLEGRSSLLAFFISITSYILYHFIDKESFLGECAIRMTVFSFGFLLFFGFSYLMCVLNLRKVYKYLTKEKTFEYKPLSITHKEFILLCNNGIPSGTYISIEDNIHYIEVDSKGNYYIDFNTLKSEEEFLNYKLENTSLDKLKNITIIAYKEKDPTIIVEREK